MRNRRLLAVALAGLSMNCQGPAAVLAQETKAHLDKRLCQQGAPCTTCPSSQVRASPREAGSGESRAERRPQLSRRQ